MTNKDWLLKSKAVQVEDVCQHRAERICCMKIQIKVNGRPFAGAKEPKFNAKCINESKLGEYGLRFKECNAWLDVDAKEGGVDWLAQEADRPNDDFDHELVRAFVANGARPGTTIHLRFGRRGGGYKVNYDLKT